MCVCVCMCADLTLIWQKKNIFKHNLTSWVWLSIAAAHWCYYILGQQPYSKTFAFDFSIVVVPSPRPLSFCSSFALSFTQPPFWHRFGVYLRMKMANTSAMLEWRYNPFSWESRRTGLLPLSDCVVYVLNSIDIFKNHVIFEFSWKSNCLSI